jgi:hypothetical protein
MISQVDMLASFSRMLHVRLPEDYDMDSEDMLNALMGKSNIGRAVLVEQGLKALSIVQNDWKYIEPSNEKPMDELTNIELGNSKQPQLYYLADDSREKYNIAEKHPLKVKELAEALQKIRERYTSK